MLAGGAAAGFAGALPSFADDAGFFGVWDQYAAPRDRGLKQFLATQPQLLVPDGAPASVVIAPPIAGVERLIVSGAVTNGAAPVLDAALYVYHTDADGFYNPACSGCGNHIVIARLHGAMRTDAQGRYRFETNRPGPYGGGEAHIHVVITTPEAGWQFEITFGDDPVAQAWLNGTKPMPVYAPNVSLRPIARKGDGIGRISQNIVLS
jgi:protocatechuate 3,4-dioxygenase beta subunit